MVYEKEIELPHTLATLPRPIDSVNGTICSSCVHSLSGSRKRKRTEVVVGIDGEGANIYNIKSPALVASYPLPPQTRFATTPVSIYRKKTKLKPAERLTYAPVIASGPAKNGSIIHFAEEVKQIPGPGPTTSKYDLPSNSPIFSINAASCGSASSTASDAIDVVVVHENGDVICLSGDLQSTRWKSKLTLGKPKEVCSVQYTTVVDGASAAKGLLKGREDIISSLRSSGQGSEADLRMSQILCVCSASEESPSNTQLQLFRLRTHHDGEIGSRSTLQELLRWPLPNNDIDMDFELRPTYSLHASSGMFYQSSQGTISSFDLTGTAPKLISQLKTVDPMGTEAHFESFARLSSSFILATSTVQSTLRCAIYDVKYSSQHASITIEPAQSSPDRNKKRKIADTGSNPTSLKGLTYFADSNMVVALSGNELVGLQINFNRNDSAKSLATRGLLIDSIGKGLPSHATTAHLPLEVKQYSNFIRGVAIGHDDAWLSTRENLRLYQSKGDVAAFEQLFATSLWGSPPSITDSAKDISMTNSDDTEENPPKENALVSQEWTDSDWDLSMVNDALPHREKALFALGEMFSFAEDIEGVYDVENPVVMHFFPPNVFRWLLLTGQLSGDLISEALREISLSADKGPVTDADLISAIVEYDPDMHLLHLVLRERVNLPIKAVAASIKYLVRSLDNTPFPPASTISSPQHLINGEAGLNQERLAADEEELASKDLSHALTTLESGLTTRSRSLRHALTRLHAFPPPFVAPALREALTRHELVFLIQILRVELSDGGWTTRYIDERSDSLGPSALDDDESEEGRPSDRGIGIIAGLLGYVVDALGMAGWLGSSGTGKGESELLLALRAEISASLEGIHEAIFLDGLLGEFMLFETAVRKADQNDPQASKQWKASTAAQMELGGLEALEASMLPIGAKPPPVVERYKTQIDGIKKAKSARERGMERSMRVPKYSLERIRF